MTPGDETGLFNLEAERAVLGALLLDNDKFNDAGDLSPEDFYQPAHAVIFDAMVGLRREGSLIDEITLSDELLKRGRMTAAGGRAYLTELTTQVPTVAYVAHHARVVSGHSAQRRAASNVQFAAERMARGEAHAAVWQDLSKAMGAGAVQALASLRVSSDLEDLYNTSMSRAQGIEKALKTPWQEFNDMMGGRGLWPGMYVLVGSTGSGKSQWAVQLAVQAALAGDKALYLALELSRRDLAARVMGVVAGVAWSRLLRGEMYPDEIDGAFERAARAVSDLPLYTECGMPFGYGVDTMVARAWALRPKLIVLDYLQLCSGKHNEEPRQVVGRVSYAARALARDLGAVVIVLSSTARTNYAELVSDVDKDPAELVGLGKESGEIEYAADGVLVLSRNPKAEDKTERVLVIAKNRYGGLGRVTLKWSGTLFEQDAGAPTPPQTASNGVMV